MVGKYKTPVAFKSALEHRLKQEQARVGRDLQRIRQLLIFDRFLARIMEEFGDAVVTIPATQPEICASFEASN